MAAAATVVINKKLKEEEAERRRQQALFKLTLPDGTTRAFRMTAKDVSQAHHDEMRNVISATFEAFDMLEKDKTGRVKIQDFIYVLRMIKQRCDKKGHTAQPRAQGATQRSRAFQLAADVLPPLLQTIDRDGMDGIRETADDGTITVGELIKLLGAEVVASDAMSPRNEVVASDAMTASEPSLSVTPTSAIKRGLVPEAPEHVVVQPIGQAKAKAEYEEDMEVINGSEFAAEIARSSVTIAEEPARPSGGAFWGCMGCSSREKETTAALDPQDGSKRDAPRCITTKSSKEFSEDPPTHGERPTMNSRPVGGGSLWCGLF